MKKKVLIGFLVMLGLAIPALVRTPLFQSFLQSNMDGAGYSITNLSSVWATNFFDAATGIELTNEFVSPSTATNIAAQQARFATNGMLSAVQVTNAAIQQASYTTNGIFATITNAAIQQAAYVTNALLSATQTTNAAAQQANWATNGILSAQQVTNAASQQAQYATNGLAIIAGSNITVTTNGAGSFTIASTASGGATGAITNNSTQGTVNLQGPVNSTNGVYQGTTTLAFTRGTNVIVDFSTGTRFKLLLTTNAWLIPSNINSVLDSDFVLKTFMASPGLFTVGLGTNTLGQRFTIPGGVSFTATTNVGAADLYTMMADYTGTNTCIVLAPNFK